LTGSVYHTTEEEFSDIIASYELGDVNTNLGSEGLGEITNASGIGSQINRARNELDALILKNHSMPQLFLLKVPELKMRSKQIA